MDSFDWNELREGVEEYGHGCVTFLLRGRGAEPTYSRLDVDAVIVSDDEEEIEVILKEY